MDVEIVNDTITSLRLNSNNINLNIIDHSEVDGSGNITNPLNNIETIINKFEIFNHNINIIGSLSKICRLCLSESDEIKLLYEEESCLPEMIMSIASVQINPDDELPLQICLHCFYQVQKCLSFKEQIENADSTLRQLSIKGILSSEIDIEQIKIDTSDEKEQDSPEIEQDSQKEENEQSDVEDEFEELSEIEDQDQVPEQDDLDEIKLSQEFIDTTNNQSNDKIDEINAIYDNNSVVENNFYGHGNFPVILSETENNSGTNSENVIDDSKKFVIVKRRGRRKTKLLSHDKKSFTNLSRKNFHRKKFNNDPKSEGDNEEENHNNNDYIIIASDNARKPKPRMKSLLNYKDNHDDSNKCEEKDSKLYPYTCDECLAGFMLEGDLKIHSAIHSKDGKWICIDCKKEFKTSLQLRRHVRIHYEDKPHKCSICRKGFPEMGSLTRHFRRHTGEQREKKHVCNICGKGYYDSHSLSVHVRTHTGEKPWVCSSCGKAFIDSRLLNSHMKIHSDDRPYECNKCNKRFTHQSTLTTHIRTHTGEKPYICSTCGKAFIQSSNLSLHMRVHSGEKPYSCSVCSKKFASSSTLTMHVRIHTGEKPFNCQQCGKKFARHDLSAHMRTHTGEKPYECNLCPKKFKTTGQLTQHLRTHSGEKRYSCPICNKRCTSAAYLKKHCKLHGDVSAEALQHLNLVKKSSKVLTKVKTSHNVNRDSYQQRTSTNMLINVNDVDGDQNHVYVTQQHDYLQKLNSMEHIDMLTEQVTTILPVTTSDYNQISIHVPVLTTTNDMHQQQIDNENLDTKHIYQAIDPNIIRIQQVHSAGKITHTDLEIIE